MTNPPPIDTPMAAWDEYRSMVYPRGFTNIAHEVQIKRSFFAGMLITFHVMQSIADNSTSTAELNEAIAKTADEVSAICRQLRDEVQAQINEANVAMHDPKLPPVGNSLN